LRRRSIGSPRTSDGEARLSVSAVCVFAPVASREAGAAVLADCPAGMRGFVALGVDDAPAS
jgi:hypothetical protein